MAKPESVSNKKPKTTGYDPTHKSPIHVRFGKASSHYQLGFEKLFNADLF